MTTIYKINDNNTLSIYCLKPNYREIEQYKRNIIKRRGIEFFDFETDLFEKSVKLDSEREMDIDEFINKKNEYCLTHQDIKFNSFPISDEIIIRNNIVNKYLRGFYKYANPIKTYVYDSDMECYRYCYNFLVPKSYMSKDLNNVKYKNILSIPSELMNIELINKGEFSYLYKNKTDIKEQIDLYEFGLVNNIKIPHKLDYLFSKLKVTKEEFEITLLNSECFFKLLNYSYSIDTNKQLILK